MITEDYISFEIAKLLKEKGFNEKCQAMYDKDGHLIPSNFKLLTKSDKRLFVADAPTLQMAIKWLREVYKCYITFTWEFKEYDKNYKPVYKDITWSFNIGIPKYNSARKGNGDYFDLDSDKEYDSYETACEAAIKYCLEKFV